MAAVFATLEMVALRSLVRLVPVESAGVGCLQPPVDPGNAWRRARFACSPRNKVKKAPRTGPWVGGWRVPPEWRGLRYSPSQRYS